MKTKTSTFITLASVLSLTMMSSPSLTYFSICCGILGLASCINLYRTSEQIRTSFIQEKRLTNFFFEKNEQAWGIFSTDGSYKLGNAYLRKLLTSNNPEVRTARLNWDLVAETLQVKNLYHFKDIKDGSHSLKLDGINLQIYKSEKLNKVMVSITKVTQFKKMASEVVKELPSIQINSIIEDSIEALASTIHANKIMINFEAKQDFTLKTTEEVFRQSFQAMLQDAIIYSKYLGQSKKLDILLYQEQGKPEIRILLYGNPVTQSSLHTNIGQNGKEWSLENSISKLEVDLSMIKTKVQIQNNLNSDRSPLFSQINIQFG